MQSGSQHNETFEQRLIREEKEFQSFFSQIDKLQSSAHSLREKRKVGHYFFAGAKPVKEHFIRAKQGLRQLALVQNDAPQTQLRQTQADNLIKQFHAMYFTHYFEPYMIAAINTCCSLSNLIFHMVENFIDPKDKNRYDFFDKCCDELEQKSKIPYYQSENFPFEKILEQCKKIKNLLSLSELVGDGYKEKDLFNALHAILNEIDFFVIKRGDYVLKFIEDWFEGMNWLIFSTRMRNAIHELGNTIAAIQSSSKQFLFCQNCYSDGFFLSDEVLHSQIKRRRIS